MIRISELILENAIILDLKAKDKIAVIKEMTEKIAELKLIADEETFLSDILKRENLESTGIGLGVAIPHARTNAAQKIILSFGRSSHGVDFNSLDGKPSQLIFLIAAPESNKSLYIMALARLSKIMRKEDVRNRLLDAAKPEEIINIIKAAE